MLRRYTVEPTLALILAGGRGKRMGILCHHRAKPLLPFAGTAHVIDFTMINCIHSHIQDIDVSVVGDTLTIKGERKAESEVKKEDYYCCERSYGSFFRSISLPSHVDDKKIEASYADGVLEINLPKIPEIKPKKISVSAKKKEKG